jgi:hypothetical protein
MRLALFYIAAQIKGVHEIVQKRDLGGHGIFVGQMHATPI